MASLSFRILFSWGRVISDVFGAVFGVVTASYTIAYKNSIYKIISFCKGFVIPSFVDMTINSLFAPSPGTSLTPHNHFFGHSYANFLIDKTGDGSTTTYRKTCENNK